MSIWPSVICHFLRNWANIEWQSTAILCAFVIYHSLSPLYRKPMWRSIQDGRKVPVKAIVAFSIELCFAGLFQSREGGPNRHLASIPFSPPPSTPLPHQSIAPRIKHCISVGPIRQGRFRSIWWDNVLVEGWRYCSTRDVRRCVSWMKGGLRCEEWHFDGCLEREWGSWNKAHHYEINPAEQWPLTQQVVHPRVSPCTAPQQPPQSHIVSNPHVAVEVLETVCHAQGEHFELWLL